jgi:hypothetical protein
MKKSLNSRLMGAGATTPVPQSVRDQVRDEHLDGILAAKALREGRSTEPVTFRSKAEVTQAILKLLGV